jgi:hypothetical protein
MDKHLEAIKFLRELGEELSYQDNRATNEPMFCVYDYVTAEELDYKTPIMTAVFFTRAAADRHIMTHGHNMMNPYVYVASAWRNQQWCTIRELAIQLYLEHVERQQGDNL